MTITCAWCGYVMGEKCATCGEPGKTVDDGLTFTCANLHIWIRGQGGTTDSICPQCKEEHFPAERAALVAPSAS